MNRTYEKGTFMLIHGNPHIKKRVPALNDVKNLIDPSSHSMATFSKLKETDFLRRVSYK